jgi:hypothetical protein
MPGVRAVIAARREHRYANTRPWIVFNSFLSSVFDTVDLSIALSRYPFIQPRLAADRALYVFKRIIRRHLADVQVHDKCAISDHFRAMLLQFAVIKALRVLYPHCANMFNLRYLDFLYLQAAECIEESFNERPILDIIWNNQDLLKDMCSLSSACIILALHNGFAHTTRTLSLSEKKIATVIGFPDLMLTFYRLNKVRNPRNIEIVPVNRHTLLTLTKIAKQNKAIICAPDYVNPDTGNCDILSLAMFKLAEYTEVPLYFVDYLIDESAILRRFIKGPVENKAAANAAEDFLNFCRSVSGRDLSLTH